MRLARILYGGGPRLARAVAGGYVLDEERVEIAQADAFLLAPSEPTKILAVGWNFPEHIEEMVARLPTRTFPEKLDEPIIFLKPPSSLVPHLGPIVYPSDATRVEHEGELSVVIGARMRRVTPEQAQAGVLGWCCGNDVTERDMQARDRQWWRAKGYDTFAPLGPGLETDTPDPDARILTRVNGETRQQGRVRDMIRDPWQIIAFVSQAVTLLPGDVIMLGTPPGVGPLVPGDTVEVDIEGVGLLSNAVVAE